MLLIAEGASKEAAAGLAGEQYSGGSRIQLEQQGFLESAVGARSLSKNYHFQG